MQKLQKKKKKKKKNRLETTGLTEAFLGDKPEARDHQKIAELKAYALG